MLETAIAIAVTVNAGSIVDVVSIVATQAKARKAAMFASTRYGRRRYPNIGTKSEIAPQSGLMIHGRSRIASDALIVVGSHFTATLSQCDSGCHMIPDFAWPMPSTA